MAHFALTTVHGPGWDDSRPIREQAAWDDHARFMDSLVDRGFIVVGGPVGDGSETLHCVHAENEREVEATMAADPWASMGLLKVGSIRPWALWLDERQRAG